MDRKRFGFLQERHFLFFSIIGFLGFVQVGNAAPTKRQVQIQRGDFTWIGNTLGFDCRSGLTDPLVGTIDRTKCGSNTSDTSTDVFWQVDQPMPGQAQANQMVTAAQASSQAKLVLPIGAVVTYARIYWAATLADHSLPFNKITLARRNTAHTGDVFSQPLTADIPIMTVTDPENVFRPGRAVQSSADVTNLVKTYGTGEYLVRDVLNIASPVNQDRQSLFYAWWMVVFYELPSEPIRHLALFDDLEELSNVPMKNTVNALVDGFLVPGSSFDAKFGVVAFEGDHVFTGDQLWFKSGTSMAATQLSNTNNPANNFFNATKTWLGMPVSTVGDLPKMSGLPESMHGMDMDVVDITSYLNHGDTQATLTAKTTSETFFLAGFVTSIATYQPLFSDMMKIYQNTSGANDKIKQGHIVEYTINGMNNVGNNGATNVIWSDTLPAKVEYVPGSLAVKQGMVWVPLTDAAGDDVGDYNTMTQTLTVRLGTGANATQGGTVSIGQSAGEIKFQVKVKADSIGDVANQAQISTKGQGDASTLPAYVFLSGDGVTKGVPTIFSIFICDSNEDCSPETPYCDKSIPSNPVCTNLCYVDADCTAIHGNDWVCEGQNEQSPKYCIPTADLGLLVTSSEPNSQNEVSYEVGIHNLGPGRPPSAVVSYQLPQNAHIVSMEVSPTWNCNVSSSVLLCISSQPIEWGSEFVIRLVVAGEMDIDHLPFHGTVQPTGMRDLHQENNTVDISTPLKVLSLAGGGFTCHSSTTELFSFKLWALWFATASTVIFLLWRRTRPSKRC